MEISTEILPHRTEFLALERAAARAYNDFAFADADEAGEVQALLFDAGVAEYAASYSRVLTDDGKVLGMISCMSASTLIKCRMRSAYTLARAGLLSARPDLQRRLELAGKALMKIGVGDFYLSRIATAAGNGLGLGSTLMRFCAKHDVSSGAERICLEVAGGNLGAKRFYERHGFTTSQTQSVSDPVSGRDIQYDHMIKNVQL